LAYFPMFIDLENKKVLIVGGGTVALRKAEKLLPYKAALLVVAHTVDKRIKLLEGLRYEERDFDASLLDGCCMVIAATDNHRLNHSIADMCNEKNIPVNVVDDKKLCSFIFPSLVKRGDLSVGISTGGASPSAAIWLRERIEQLLPESLPKILDYLSEMRGEVKMRLVREKNREYAFKHMFSACMEKGRELDPEEYETLIREAENI